MKGASQLALKLSLRRRELVKPTPDKVWSSHGKRWNFRHTVYDLMLSNVALGMVTPFLAVYAMALGGSNSAVGMVTAIPALINTIMYLPAASYVERQRSRLNTSIKWWIQARLLYLAMAGVAFLPAAELRTPTLLAIIGLQAIPTVISNVAFTSMLGDLFPAGDRAQLFSLRSMYGAVVTLLSSLAAGILLDEMKYPTNYAALFVITFVAGMWALRVCRRIVEAPVEQSACRRASLWQRVGTPFKDQHYGKQFTAFAVSAALLHLGINISTPTIPIYYVRTLGLSNSVIGSLTLAAGLTTMLAYPLWGKVGRRSGDGAVYLASVLGLAFFPVVYGMNGAPAFLIAVQLVSGVFTAALNLSLLNLLLQVVRPSDCANGIAVFNMLINATGIIGPPIAAEIISRFGVRDALTASTIVRLAGCIVYIAAVGPGETVRQLMAGTRAGARRMRNRMRGRGRGRNDSVREVA